MASGFRIGGNMFARILSVMTLPRVVTVSLAVVFGAAMGSGGSGARLLADPPASKPDTDGVPTPAPPPSSLIDALRQQITGNPVLKDADPDGHLLDSLDAADERFQQAKRQNWDAIRRLNRQPRVGEARQTPHLVLITVDALAQPTADEPPLPSWNSFAQDGVTFTHHYAGGGDVETGQWTLLTSRNSGRATHPAGEPRILRSEDDTFARWLWKAGYDTAYLGPWSGAAHPLQKGFEAWTGFLTPTQTPTEFPAALATARSTMRVPSNENGQRGTSVWRLLTIEADSLFERLAERPRPLFLHVRLPQLAELSPEANRAAWDETIAGLLATIKSRGLEPRTCVVLTALTGAPRDADDLREVALRTPLLIRWPGHWSVGPVVNDVTFACDLGPTLLDLAAATSRPSCEDGVSLLPLLRKQSLPARELLYWKSPGKTPTQAVRQGPWKAIYTAGDRQLRLYDLGNDPTETTDVAAQHSDIARKLVRGPAELVEQVVK
jgi:hypothetical protein